MIRRLFFRFSLTRPDPDFIIIAEFNGGVLMSSVPYSRYIFGTIPWYSFLIVTGVVIAVFLACREEEHAGLPKDTVIDLALWLIPFGIIGARIYYVIFSWEQFRNDLLSVFRIWEGGIAIYGGIIAGLIVLLLFCRKRRLSAFTLCDIIAPGLVLAQAIGRWGNWFNIEAYGLQVTDPSLCFFPFALQVPAEGNTWHLATFFYESVWNLCIFIFLMIGRRKRLRARGDVFCFYLLLYASGRLVIEDLRLDSLYASSSVRVSQLLSILICMSVIIRYVVLLHRQKRLSAPFRYVLLPLSSVASVFALIYALFGSFSASWPAFHSFLFLAGYAFVMIVSLFLLHHALLLPEVHHADDEA